MFRKVVAVDLNRLDEAEQMRPEGALPPIENTKF